MTYADFILYTFATAGAVVAVALAALVAVAAVKELGGGR